MRFASTLVLLVLLLSAESTRAGGRLPCYEARVFSGAAVNALILPYRYTGKSTDSFKSTGSRLAALIQKETLFAMLKYGSVGATELVSSTGELCDVRDVLAQVMKRTDKHKLRPGHGLVIIWGRIYEEGQDVYVQSYIRFLRRDEDEAIKVDLSAPADRWLQMTAALPTHAVAMVPRQLTQNDIKEIEQKAAETLVMRDEPKDEAKAKPITQSPHEPLTYGVEEAMGDWMKIRSYITGKTGWVRARSDSEAWGLRRFLPELAYLDGVVGYLRLRSAEHVPLTNNPKRTYTWIQQAFTDYEMAVGIDAAANAAGLSRAMRGLLLWNQSELVDIHKGRQQAAQLFQQAVEYIPDSSDARVLATITAPYRKTELTLNQTMIKMMNTGLLGALALDSRNTSALVNLERLYELTADVDDLALYESKELEVRLAVIKTAREKIKGNADE